MSKPALAMVGLIAGYAVNTDEQEGEHRCLFRLLDC
jgi:hypothetical protein